MKAGEKTTNASAFADDVNLYASSLSSSSASLIGSTCKKWFNLPHDVNNAYFHSKVQDSGFGIISMR